MHDYDTVDKWWRALCPVTERILISGDLHDDPKRAVAQLEGWRRSGITHVLDTRFEWSDEDLVAEHEPEITYGWIGTDDDGGQQPDEWFDSGLEFVSEALDDPDSVLLIHCHMGINRGPTMAYRVLLESGWDPIDGLDAIRHARPIADIGYAGDALDHYHRNHKVALDQQVHNRDRLAAWQRGYPTTGLHSVRPSP